MSLDAPFASVPEIRLVDKGAFEHEKTKVLHQYHELFARIKNFTNLEEYVFGCSYNIESETFFMRWRLFRTSAERAREELEQDTHEVGVTDHHLKKWHNVLDALWDTESSLYRDMMRVYREKDERHEEAVKGFRLLGQQRTEV